MKGAVSEASVCSQGTVSLSGGEREVWAPSLGAVLTLQLLLYCNAGAPCKGSNPCRAVCQLHVWISCMWAWDLLCCLFHYCCYVVWVWPELFKVELFSILPKLHWCFPLFSVRRHWFSLFLQFSLPIFSCSTEDLYMSQDMIPLRIYLIYYSFSQTSLFFIYRLTSTWEAQCFP